MKKSNLSTRLSILLTDVTYIFYSRKLVLFDSRTNILSNKANEGFAQERRHSGWDAKIKKSIGNQEEWIQLPIIYT
jgi:hypothetical protein